MLAPGAPLLFGAWGFSLLRDPTPQRHADPSTRSAKQILDCFRSSIIDPRGHVGARRSRRHRSHRACRDLRPAPSGRGLRKPAPLLVLRARALRSAQLYEGRLREAFRRPLPASAASFASASVGPGPHVGARRSRRHRLRRAGGCLQLALEGWGMSPAPRVILRLIE